MCKGRNIPRSLSVLFGCALAASIWSSATSSSGQTQDKTASERGQTNAPTGIYATDAPVRLRLRLDTNGVYEVRDELGKQQGTWQWDGKKREFWLKPSTGKFSFELRRLRVDRYDPNCLQWIPVPAVDIGGGAVDYVRFIRQKD